VARSTLDFSTVPEASKRLFGDRFGDSPVPVGLVVAPDGSVAWVAATQADVVGAIDPVTLAVRDLLRAGREPDGMALSAAGPAASGE
jgi:streptogramin lyase